MIKMDVLIIFVAMFLAYAGIILLYYRIRANERKTKISNFMLKGTMSMRRGNLERALVYFTGAYEYSIDRDNKFDAAEALYNIGYIYKEEGELSVAKDYWEHADDLYNEINDNKGSNKIKAALKSITE
jgi:tetratricopeptide (TPR) repeat protein